uniref:ATP-binding cassette, sub-family C (CFTR/MRP), member 10 n=1 Tax=Salarias fasciatus TaxID=181472 RepID=A0A672G572_SALFA
RAESAGRTSSDRPLPLWQDGNFSPCFNQLVLGALPHAAMAVCSACYLGMARCGPQQAPPPCSWTLRLLSALLLAALLAADVALAGVLRRPDVFLLLLCDGAGVLAWLLHAGAVAALRRTAWRWGRGPPPLPLLVLLSAPHLVVTLMLHCETEPCLNPAEPLSLARFVLAAARAPLLLLYLLAFAFPCVGDAGYTLHINAADDSPPPLPWSSAPDTGEVVAEDGSGCASRLFYLWLSPLLRRGRRGELDRPDQVYHLPRKLRTAAVRSYFEQCWEACGGRSPGSPEVGGATEPDGEVGLLRVLHTAFGRRYYVLGALKATVNLSSFAGPLLLNGLVSYMEEGAAPASRGVCCALGLFASTLLCSVLRNVFVFEVSKVALSARAALVSAIYGKALRLRGGGGGGGLAGCSLGEAVNLMSADTDRVVNFFNSFHELWSLPFRFAVTLYLLYLQVGVAFLGGLAVALLLVPFNKFLASRIVSNNKHMLRCKDSRVKLMTEILFGIRVIKFYSWEAHFARKVAECRRRELSHLKAVKYLDALCVYTWAALPVLICILTFVTYVLLGHQLTAAKVFTTLALVGMLIIPLNSFPWVLNGVLEAKVSLERIQRFFSLPSRDLQAHYGPGRTRVGPAGSRTAARPPGDERTAVLLSQASFSREGPGGGGALLLHGVNLHVAKGSLVVLVGKVGSGKSSLLAAITGELSRTSGVLYVADRDRGVGLASQEPWIQHASVRENILFGREYDAAFYQAVIQACALADDLSVLPDGDRTEVGENGVTLSGGQKARLALARAAYMDKPLYLLDDPLAAVDSDVAEHLMRRCILDLLRGKTRILCTHRIELAHRADMVVLVDDGTIVRTGSPAEILPLVEAAPKKSKNENHRKEEGAAEHEEQEPGSIPGLGPEDGRPDGAGEEQKQAGALAWSVYRTYWGAVGGVLASAILTALLLMQASKNVSDWWLSSVRPLQAFLSNRSDPDVTFYLTVYGCLGAANSVFTALRAFLFAYGVVAAAAAIHTRLLDRVLKATLGFFDTTPVGRVLNRFSSDLYGIDDSLPFILNILLANGASLLGALAVMGWGLPWVLLPLAPLALAYHRTQRFYRHTSRELKRLCSLTLSPVYSHFSETLTGLATVRASGSAARFEEESARRLEQNQRCLFLSTAAMQWLDIRLQLIGVAVVTGLGTIAVVQHQFNAVDPGLVGLALSYALSITSLLSGIIFSFTQTEMQLVSVERTEEYSTSLPSEPQQRHPQLPPAWPQQGRLEFRDVVLAYREGLPNALDGVSLVVRPGEKVGIVGRTGSGKSTMFLALFRMVELNRGQILLDQLDISTVGLDQLRSRLAIIPQDPFLFSGTVRENLDPCGLQADRRLLEVLDQCHLSSAVSRMGGLDAEVGDRGQSFSAGQRQLLCLARALLTDAKVLCIDEATASVDQRTDQLLQRTIRDEFHDRTVLTIAHRINTILDCERVLVMHAGKVVEFDSPAALCRSDGSIFQRLLGDGTDRENGGTEPTEGPTEGPG